MFDKNNMQKIVDDITNAVGIISIKYLDSEDKAAAVSKTDYSPAKYNELVNTIKEAYNTSVSLTIARLEKDAEKLLEASVIPFDANDEKLINWANLIKTQGANMPAEAICGLSEMYAGNKAALRILANANETTESVFSKSIKNIEACMDKLKKAVNVILLAPYKAPIGASGIRDALWLYAKTYGIDNSKYESDPQIIRIRQTAINLLM